MEEVPFFNQFQNDAVESLPKECTLPQNIIVSTSYGTMKKCTHEWGWQEGVRLRALTSYKLQFGMSDSK